MGAISTMNTEAIEASLLQFARKHDEVENVAFQSAFALAEIEGSSPKVFDYLDSMSQGNDPQTRNTGLLSLGVLGRQEEPSRWCERFFKKKSRGQPT